MTQDDELMTENLVLIDWVSLTSKVFSASQMMEYLSLHTSPWTSGHGARGYKHREYFSGISIMHDKPGTEYQTWLEMSGQGCRSFESEGSGDYDSIFDLVRRSPDQFNLTRLDVAFDDHTGVLDIDKIFFDVCKQNYVSRSRWWASTLSSEGTSCYIGAPSSDIRIRIYDKAAERGYTDGRHWVRVELQLRDDRAESFVTLPADMSLTDRFLSVLSNYLRFVVPQDDSNRSRWSSTDYWDELIGAVSRVKLFSKPGIPYNIESVKNFVFNQAGNAIDTAYKILGNEEFFRQLKERKPVMSDKYRDLLNAFEKTGEIPEPEVNPYQIKKYVYCPACHSNKLESEFISFKHDRNEVVGIGICRRCSELGYRIEDFKEIL